VQSLSDRAYSIPIWFVLIDFSQLSNFNQSIALALIWERRTGIDFTLLLTAVGFMIVTSDMLPALSYSTFVESYIYLCLGESRVQQLLSVFLYVVLRP
jgi:hypothetical protein